MVLELIYSMVLGFSVRATVSGMGILEKPLKK